MWLMPMCLLFSISTSYINVNPIRHYRVFSFRLIQDTVNGKQNGGVYTCVDDEHTGEARSLYRNHELLTLGHTSCVLGKW